VEACNRKKAFFHAANGKAQHCIQSAFDLIFLLSLGLAGGEGFFFIFPLFPTYSLQVPNKVPSSSHLWKDGVPNPFQFFVCVLYPLRV